MCSSKPKLQRTTSVPPTTPKMNRRPVLQPTGNQFPSLEQMKSLKKSSQEPLAPTPLPSPLPTTKTKASLSPPISPKLPSPRPPAFKRGKDSNELNSSAEKVLKPRCTTKSTSSGKKSKNSSGSVAAAAPSAAESILKNISSLIVEAPGSIAAARREQVATMQEQRKMRIAHYGRTKSAKNEGKVVPLDASASTDFGREKRRCTFITPNSDPIYVAYHDEEWGVPVHDDNLLLELLVLTGAQVGSDWTSVLRKRQALRQGVRARRFMPHEARRKILTKCIISLCREAFSGFDADIVAQFSERKITSVSADSGIDISLVRGAVDNAKQILQIKREVGSFDKYLWGFVNHKSISTQYKSCHKIPVKNSKSESISKDMVRRGFRLVGPTVIHSFMQAAGLTNDHLITCPRHLQCASSLASSPPAAAPAAL